MPANLINFIKKVISKSDVFIPGKGVALQSPFPPLIKAGVRGGDLGVAAAGFLLGPQSIIIQDEGGDKLY